LFADLFSDIHGLLGDDDSDENANDTPEPHALAPSSTPSSIAAPTPPMEPPLRKSSSSAPAAPEPRPSPDPRGLEFPRLSSSNSARARLQKRLMTKRLTELDSILSTYPSRKQEELAQKERERDQQYQRQLQQQQQQQQCSI